MRSERGKNLRHLRDRCRNKNDVCFCRLFQRRHDVDDPETQCLIKIRLRAANANDATDGVVLFKRQRKRSSNETDSDDGERVDTLLHD